MARRKKRETPGQQLRALRERLGLSLRDVRVASRRIAREMGRDVFIIPHSQLHQIEVKNAVPNIFRLYTLSRVYGRSLGEFLRRYGVPRG